LDLPEVCGTILKRGKVLSQVFQESHQKEGISHYWVEEEK
jgi:hypothetical protein